VTARIRPALEEERHQQQILKVLSSDQVQEFGQSQSGRESKVLCLRTNAHFNNGHKFYRFENILDESCDQMLTYSRCDLNRMARCFIRQGKNCNIIVYGPTNSGKTYTMIGNPTTKARNRRHASRSPTPKKTFGTVTDKKRRAKSGGRSRPDPAFTHELPSEAKQDRNYQTSQVPARLKSAVQNEDLAVGSDGYGGGMEDQSSLCHKFGTESATPPRAQPRESKQAGVIPRALR